MNWRLKRALYRAPGALLLPVHAAASPLLLEIGRAARAARVLPLLEVGVAADSVRRFHDGAGPAGGPVVCRYLLQPTLRVDPTGNMIFCEHIRRPLGSLLERPLEQIWNGREALALRRLLVARGHLPICHRCCKLVFLPGDR